MLATDPVVRIPDPDEAGMGSQVINVPVRSRRCLAMVRDAGLHASRPQGAAHVNVVAAPQFEHTEFSDLDPLWTGTRKH